VVRREPIFANDLDRETLLNMVGEAMARFDATAWAYCLMGNHYHFILQTSSGNLSRVMRHINGVYAQAFNQRHGLVGHVFQGRFKAILVDRQAYLLEVGRYVELNPVRARMVSGVADWPWSSFRSHVGQACAPPWLNTSGLHEQMLGRELAAASDHTEARALYAELVADGRNSQLWAEGLRQQIYLGDEAFVERTQSRAGPTACKSVEVPSVQRGMPKTLAQWLAITDTTAEALRRAHNESGLTMTAMANELKVSVASVSRWIRKAEAELVAGTDAATRGSAARIKT
jgi:REP element-mobilizing transposase RayT